MTESYVVVKGASDFDELNEEIQNIPTLKTTDINETGERAEDGEDVTDACSSAGYNPELSFGSHFFQDLVESGIGYDGASYRQQLLEKNVTNVYPVVTMVLYFGDTHWQYSRHLIELIKKLQNR